jgi:hypothetical protein
MGKSGIEIFSEVLSSYMSYKDKFLKNLFIHDKSLINKFYESFASKNFNDLSIQRTFILEFVKIKSNAEEINSLTSCDLNIFKMFGVGETMHSYLITNLLNPGGNQGQKQLFLNIFLDMLNINRYHDYENWVVTAEKGRIDILLKRIQPHSVIVIENKSNYAIDQENQIYRYWYQEIYSTIRNKNFPENFILNPPSEFYQLIYLSPSPEKIINEISISRPLDWDEELPKKVPMQIKQVYYPEFIVDWLQKSYDLISPNNHRLKEFINQYVDLWN